MQRTWGKVIILAGAPDAESLDWSAFERPEHLYDRLPDWPTDADDEGSQPGHPQWRVLSGEVSLGAARQVAAEPQQPLSPEPDRPVVASIQTSFQDTCLLHGCADFLELTPSQLPPAVSSTAEPAEGESLLSVDESLSFCVPQALPAPEEENGVPPGVFRSQDDGLTSFLEYSLAAHNELPSSLPEPSELWGGERRESEEEPVQVGGGEEEAGRLSEAGPSVDFDTSHGDSDLSVSAVSDEPPNTTAATPFRAAGNPPPLPALPPWQPLTCLADVPGAAYLLRLAPQTVTANLVVAVVAVGTATGTGAAAAAGPKPRRVQTRWGGVAELVELVVGDETRSGFAITMWLPKGPATTGPSSSLRTTLLTLAPQDVVLLRHVALHVFAGKVYGSSLRKDQTKLHVLYRGGGSGGSGTALYSAAHLSWAAATTQQKAARHDAEATQEPATAATADALLAKTTRVHEWALRYVLVGNGGDDDRSANFCAAEGPDTGRPTARAQAWDMPPPDDTQLTSL